MPPPSFFGISHSGPWIGCEECFPAKVYIGKALRGERGRLLWGKAINYPDILSVFPVLQAIM